MMVKLFPSNGLACAWRLSRGGRNWLSSDRVHRALQRISGRFRTGWRPESGFAIDGSREPAAPPPGPSVSNKTKGQCR